MSTSEVSPPTPPEGAHRLPAGEVTFLFSDIEGSTRAWEEHTGAMPAALAEHQRALRTAIAAHGGAVVKDTGDGLFAVFAEASPAVAAAVDAQRALDGVAWGETGPLRARMGLHTGEAEPEHGDYHGTPVNRCARIMGVAHGGQIVVSDATYARIVASPPEEVGFLDLGFFRLKDLSVAVALRQVLHPALRREFPPLRSLDALPNNLPAQLSSFVGREGELDALAAELKRTRSLTLTGAGGVGKTRLALQLAADRAHDFADGAWLVDLAGLGEPELVPRAVAAALGLEDQSGREWIDSVVWFLRARSVLLVLDNCEHLLDSVAALVRDVLERCPRVKVLVTSREPLGTPGELVWTVPSLHLAEDSGVSEAERLFRERASEADPQRVITEDEMAAVRQICRRLDGLPLAIELAAARTRVLSIPEIAERLDDRFRLLTGGTRTALPRQRTLEATVAWSYDLLDDAQRRLFERLSVFAGSFTLDAAQQVCGGPPLESAPMLDLVSALVDRSLLARDSLGPPTRLRMAETMRAYGRERLAERDEIEALRRAHLAWVNAFARAVAPGLDGPEQSRMLDVVAGEIDDVRAALAWGREGDPGTALACAATLYRYWYVRAVREGRLWLDRLLDDAHDANPKILAKALYAAGDLTEFQGEHERARALHQRALELYRRLGNRRGEAWALHGLGIAEWSLRPPAEVRERFEGALAIFREIGDPVGLAFTLQYVAIWHALQGDPSQAVVAVDELQALVRPTGVPQLIAHAAELAAIAQVTQADGVDAARGELREALELFAGIGSIYCLLHCLESTAGWAVAADMPVAAARLLGAATALRGAAGTPAPPYMRTWAGGVERRAREALGRQAYDRAASEGALLDMDDATGLARSVLEEHAPARMA